MPNSEGTSALTSSARSRSLQLGEELCSVQPFILSPVLSPVRETPPQNIIVILLSHSYFINQTDWSACSLSEDREFLPPQ